MHKNKVVGSVVAAAVIAGLAGFYGGTLYAKSGTPARRGDGFQGTGQGMFGNGGGMIRRGLPEGLGATVGTIIAKDDESITVKLADGGSRVVFLSGSTKVTKSVEGIVTDLRVGEQVTTAGTANSDGSITAQVIQLRPFMASSTRNRQ